MNISASGIATRQGQEDGTINSAIASALSFYPEFNRLPEREAAAVREDIILLINRFQHVRDRHSSFRLIEFSPQMSALMRHVGLS